jgi:energy-coupling factor transporter transmembrane protein EcfT
MVFSPYHIVLFIIAFAIVFPGVLVSDTPGTSLVMSAGLRALAFLILIVVGAYALTKLGVDEYWYGDYYVITDASDYQNYIHSLDGGHH